MKRTTLAVLTVTIGLAAVFSVYAIPWVGLTTEAADGSTTTKFHGWYGMEDPDPLTGAARAEALEVNTDIGLMFHGLLWGTVAAAIALIGYLLVPLNKQAGEAVALVGGLAVGALVFLVLGMTFLFIDVSDVNTALTDAGTKMSVTYAFNYVTPLLGLAFVGLSAWHTIKCIPHARSAFGMTRAVPVQQGPLYAPPMAASAPPQPMAVAVQSQPSPTPGPSSWYQPPAPQPVAEPAPMAPPAPAPVPAPTPAPAPKAPKAPKVAPPAPPPAPEPVVPSIAPADRDATITRVGSARAHAQHFAAMAAPGDPAMAAWLKQMDAYLDGLEARARTTTDPATLLQIEKDLDAHVFSLK